MPRAPGLHPMILLLLVLLPGACTSDGPRGEASTRRPGPSQEAGATRRLETASGLALEVPAGWRAIEPSSSMRVAQLRLPAAADEEEAELVVYWFGGTGGSVEANLERWRGQFTDVEDESSEAWRNPAGLDVHVLELSGRYVAETRPGSGQRLDLPGRRMLAAVVEGDPGPHFIKLVAQPATAELWEEAWRRLLDSLRPAGS